MNFARVRKELTAMSRQLAKLMEEEFEGVIDPVVCVAEGHLQAAQTAIEQAEDLL